MITKQLPARHLVLLTLAMFMALIAADAFSGRSSLHAYVDQNERQRTNTQVERRMKQQLVLKRIKEVRLGDLRPEGKLHRLLDYLEPLPR